MATRRAVTKVKGRPDGGSKPVGPLLMSARVRRIPVPEQSQHNACQFFYRPNVLTSLF